MKSLLTIIALSVVLMACTNSKKAIAPNQSNAKTEALSVAKAQLLQVKKSVVLILATTNKPNNVNRYYVLQGAQTKEQSIPNCVGSCSNDFVSLQSGNDFWVLTLSESLRYKSLLTNNANAHILKGFGLAKYQMKETGYDDFISELKAGKHDDKF